MITAKYDKRRTKKIKRAKHSSTSKKIIVFVIVSIFTFTGIAINVQLKTGVELSPTLITCFYAFCTGELWMLSSIKKSKLRSGQKNEQYTNIQPNITKESMEDEEPKG